MQANRSALAEHLALIRIAQARGLRNIIEATKRRAKCCPHCGKSTDSGSEEKLETGIRLVVDNTVAK